MTAKYDGFGVEVPGTRWNGSEHDGTKWVPDGQGASLLDLLLRVLDRSPRTGEADRAAAALIAKPKTSEQWTARTNLAITPGFDRALNVEDLRRVEACQIGGIR